LGAETIVRPAKLPSISTVAPPQLIIEPISRAPCPGKNKRGPAARDTMSRHPNRKKSKAKKKKYKDADAHGMRPKLIRQCRSFAAPTLVIAAQFPKE
jgi:hypothetical protein